MSNRKAVLAAILLLSFIAFLALDLGRFLSLDALKQGRAALASTYAQRPVALLALYFAGYVAMAALSLPGAAVLTLAGGAMFGLLAGTVVVSFASAIGALLAFLAARFVLRDAVRRRFGERLHAMDAGLRRDGPLYLLTLRLIPLFPFFLVNLAMGITGLRAGTFYWVSQVGMLPATVAYVYAGTQLASIESLHDILSPRLIGAFVLLAALPWIGRAIAAVVRRQKVYAPWRGARPRRFDRNLVVIGAGAAGLVSSYLAAAARASVTLVESHRMGGDCLNYGCVPSKTLIRTATLAHQMRQAARYGLGAVEPSFSFRAVMQRVHAVIRAIEPHDSAERFRGLGVDVVQGHATIVDPWTVDIALAEGGTRRLRTRSILIAAGSRPVVPPLPGLEDSGYLTSDTLWDAFAQLDAPPRRLLILGGGPIGCELGQAFARLGSQVTQVELAPRLLAREDDEVSARVHESLQADGVRLLLEHKALRCARQGEERMLVAEHAGQEVRIAFDALVCAIGRQARLEGYGLQELGIPSGRTVETNEYLQTLYPNIYAAGDVAGPYQFTHAAAHQAWYATINALLGGVHRFKVDYRVIPAATFVDPEVARVGLNEREARERGVTFEVTRFGFDELDRALADGEAEGYVKILAVPGRDRILGATIVGRHAAELIATFALAMKHGLGLNKILGTVHAYPTWSEANKYAAGEWRRAHQPQRLLAWAARFHAWRRGEGFQPRSNP